MSSFASSIASNVGSSPPQRSCTTLIGEADTIGDAMLPRNLVRTSWNGTGHLYFSSRARTCSSVAVGGLARVGIDLPTGRLVGHRRTEHCREGTQRRQAFTRCADFGGSCGARRLHPFDQHKPCRAAFVADRLQIAIDRPVVEISRSLRARKLEQNNAARRPVALEDPMRAAAREIFCARGLEGRLNSTHEILIARHVSDIDIEDQIACGHVRLPPRPSRGSPLPRSSKNGGTVGSRLPATGTFFKPDAESGGSRPATQR